MFVFKVPVLSEFVLVLGNARLLLLLGAALGFVLEGPL